MVQLPAAGLVQNRYWGVTQLGPVAFAVRVTVEPVAADQVERADEAARPDEDLPAGLGRGREVGDSKAGAVIDLGAGRGVEAIKAASVDVDHPDRPAGHDRRAERDVGGVP